MIAPEERGAGNGEAPLRTLLRNNLLVSALIFAALQVWRPCFFLTDDNCDGAYPFFMNMGRQLLHGQSPFHSSNLFGGNYDLLRDPTFFAWHPQYMLVSLLAGTPLGYLMVDINAFLFLLLGTAGFVCLGDHLRRELSLKISDGWFMFYSMSFSYSMIVIATGASWINFLGNQSALPWLALGLFQRSWRRGLFLVALFGAHQILGGHLEPTISTNLFLSLFALGVAWWRRSWIPAISWFGGSLIAVAIVLPVLVPAFSGFLGSTRAQGVDLTDMSNNNIPDFSLPASVFWGMALWYIHPPVTNFTETYTMSLGACAAAWCFAPAIAVGRWHKLEWMILGMLLLLGLFIARPAWVSEIMLRLPLLKSMRWPFREFLQFQLFFHLFLLLRSPGMVPRLRWIFAGLGIFFFVPPLLIHAPPTFAQMEEDRQLIFSGGLDRYWAQVRPFLSPEDRYAVIIPVKLYLDETLDKPFSLLGTYNYAVLAGERNVWGWSQTPPRDQFYVHTAPLYVFGAYNPSQRAALTAEKPHLRFITLESLDPLKITLESADGRPTVDLTPFAPPDLSGRLAGGRKRR